jgi:hypothetical protein
VVVARSTEGSKSMSTPRGPDDMIRTCIAGTVAHNQLGNLWATAIRTVEKVNIISWRVRIV